MTQNNQQLKNMFNSIVRDLRSQGWTRFDAEGEALNRIEVFRLQPPPPESKP